MLKDINMIRTTLQKAYNVVGLEKSYFVRDLESCFLKKSIIFIWNTYLSFGKQEMGFALLKAFLEAWIEGK